jgi:hypothetical protein
MAQAIKIESTDKSLSAYGGLVLGIEAFKTFNLKGIAHLLPELSSGHCRSMNKFEAMMLGAMAGAECLDDLEVLASDAAYEAVVSKTYTAKSYGNFLRSFTDYQCKTLQHALINQSFALRAHAVGKTASFVIDVDTTSNQQYGKKMEGVETNYKNIECLDTLKAFDEFGFPYWHEVRPGATNTSVGAAEVISSIFRNMPNDSCYGSTKRFIRGDSGYCNVDVFNACRVANALFVTRMRENMLEPRIDSISKWYAQDNADPNRIRIYDGRECEIGETYYFPEGGLETLRIVCLRAEKFGLQSVPLFSTARYDYYAFVTNIANSEMTAREVVEFYRKRGNAENFIREDKNNFDLKHYPCLKLTANKAYGLITAFAAAYMRYLSLIQGGTRARFAKAIRNRLIHLPVQIIRHAREVVFKFTQHHIAEVRRTLQRIKNLQISIVSTNPEAGGCSLKFE